MSEPGSTEQIVANHEYETLILQYPADTTPTKGPSFPDWEVTDEEYKWAESFLSVGTNDQMMKDFGSYLGCVGKKGLQLLRNSSVMLCAGSLDKLRENLSPENLVDYLRNEFQSDSLFFEEGLRGAREIENKYWNGEDDDQLGSSRKRLKKSNSAFREINDFMEGKTNKLSAVRVFVESNYNAHENAAIHNENHFRERGAIDSSTGPVGAVMDRDSRDLVFWSSISSFVENLELSKQ